MFAYNAIALLDRLPLRSCSENASELIAVYEVGVIVVEGMVSCGSPIDGEKSAWESAKTLEKMQMVMCLW